MDVYGVNLACLLALCGALFVAQGRGARRQPGDDGEEDKMSGGAGLKMGDTHMNKNKSKKAARWPFLTVYALVMGADWLQGPFLYSLYTDEHALPHSLVSALFTTGFLSGGISGTFIGTLADRHGRRAACLSFCGACALSCLLTMLPSLPLLFAGRVLGGLSTSLLFSVFESWMVADVHARGNGGGAGKGDELASMFGAMGTVNSLVAIASGVGSEWLVAATGTRRAPFVGSVALLGMAFVVILTQWAEYYGETTPSTDKLSQTPTPTPSILAILTDPAVVSLGLTSTVFEGSMYLFVFFWAPALGSVHASSSSQPLPFGVIFASFMASCLAASLAFNSLPTSKHATLLLLILFTSAVCFLLSAAPRSEQATFWVFCLFEAAVGVYWPCMGCLKGRLIDDGVRARVYGMLRVPLNVFVVVALMAAGEGPEAYRGVFVVCSGLLFASCGALWVVDGRGAATVAG
ncbi:major facilitator superfamily transporter [Podospora appendiculata]|uniref:Molybdate-anion transporter n=1 Tax=Podospora appendiculata TaxID=314037 RepID=A0AAE0XEP2_9PEZI|nr:major facilitator superfamily transporter [Podospora appendiculata]